MTFLCERVISPSCTWMCPNSFNERKCNFQAAVLQEPGTIALWNSWYKLWASLTDRLFTARLMWLKMCTSNSREKSTCIYCNLPSQVYTAVLRWWLSCGKATCETCELRPRDLWLRERRQAPCCDEFFSASPARWNLTMWCSLDSVQLPYKWLNCGVYSRYNYS